MNLWNKIVLGAKFLFGGFESAVDYLMTLLNEFLAKDGVAQRVQEVREFVAKILSYMEKYEKYCPAIWVPHYEKLTEAVKSLVDITEDGKITSEELEKAIAAVKAAVDEWMK
jgi:hypothetical protein